MSNQWPMSCMAPPTVIPPFWEAGLHEDQGRPADEVSRYCDPIGSAPSLLPATRSLQPASYGQSGFSRVQIQAYVDLLGHMTCSSCGGEHLYHMLFKIKQVSQEVRSTVSAHNPAPCSGRLWRYFEEHTNNVERLFRTGN